MSRVFKQKETKQETPQQKKRKIHKESIIKQDDILLWWLCIGFNEL